jgi:uncharacterized protein YlxW (UPF0749 family)
MSDPSVNERFDRVDKSLERLSQSLDRLTQYVIDLREEITSHLQAIENRLDFLSLTVASIDSGLSALTKAHARNRVFSLSTGAGTSET